MKDLWQQRRPTSHGSNTHDSIPPKFLICSPPKSLVPNHHHNCRCLHCHHQPSTSLSLPPPLPPEGKVHECVAMGVAHVGVLIGDGDEAGDVDTGLGSVEGNGASSRQRSGRQCVNLRRKERNPS
ncbi:hypothetical protein PIB30_056614 [Stylosanthes scabra]|uniref:Uncharacterized protein n=1 Tax=Stylosanthes scabra TaxID=79078 RepID=A0ABU6YHL0_9FABA|nr:hypothetical protein [Stylosanthes scabra]